MFRFICTILLASIAANGQQLLYNGIRLPEVWPPRDVVLTNEPTPVPSYLVHPPAVIPIDVGRQLFVDDFLIEQTNLRREYHRPEMYSGNPVLKADRSWEDGRAMPYSGGAFYDPKDQLFKIWYESSGGMLYATSRDGVHWEKPDLGVMPGTNVVQAGVRESSTVWLDLDEKDPQRRYKMGRSQGDIKPVEYFVSADGIHWSQPIAKSVPTGDRTTFFKNPFRNVWVLSSRDHDYLPPWFSVTTGPAANWALRRQPPEKFKGFVGRIRRYLESPEFETMSSTNSPTLVSYAHGEKEPTTPPPTAPLWTMADRLDPRRIDLNVQPQLYNLDAVAYESVMLGFFAIWPGQSPDIDKLNYLNVGYSRDGFHWYRPDRRPFIAPTEKHGDWNYANVQSVGGVALVVGDRLFFYVSGRGGVPGRTASGDTSAGLATIRRDGFSSMDAGGTPRFLMTRPVRFSGKRLFVNVDSTAGEMRVEVLDMNNKVLKNFSADDCMPLHIDSTLTEVRWRGIDDLSSISRQPVKFRFILRDARLFSFWVSPDERGSSNGYVAAGGPGFTSTRDTEGIRAYQFCCKPVQ